MKVLLAHNSTYFPSLGGGDKSNRLLMEALVERGHSVRVVTRVEQFGQDGHDAMLAALKSRGVEADGTDGTGIRYELGGVVVRVLSLSPHLRGFFQAQIDEFQPDIIITSTDDPGQLLFDIAVKAPNARVVYLVRATIAVPFGPDSSMVSASKTEVLKRADATVGVSHYVAGYVREWSGIDAIHVPISLLEDTRDFPLLGHFENPYVAMVNPCAVKGISIFVELADRMPHVQFAAIPTWGTQVDELAAMRQRPNITLLNQMDNIDGLLRQTKVMLVPSVWAEARSRIVLEAMSRGIPVVASDVGGLHEAKLGVPYLIRVNPIVKYKPSVDASMVPVAEVPPQDVTPWHKVMERLTTDQCHWEELAASSRKAALEYAANLNVLPFEGVLEGLLRKPKKQPPAPTLRPALSEEKKKLLALRLKHCIQQVPATAGSCDLMAGDTAFVSHLMASLQHARAAFCIHNLAYQGSMPVGAFARLCLPYAALPPLLWPPPASRTSCGEQTTMAEQAEYDGRDAACSDAHADEQGAVSVNWMHVRTSVSLVSWRSVHFSGHA